jgi:hypothetical protein
VVLLEIEEPTAEANVLDIEEPKLWTLARLGEAAPDRKPFMESGLLGSCALDESEDLTAFGLSKAFRLLERERWPTLEPGRLIFSCNGKQF